MSEGQKYPLDTIINEPWFEVANSKGEITIKTPTLAFMSFLAELGFYYTFCNGYFQFARVENNIVVTYNDVSDVIEIATQWLEDVAIDSYVKNIHIVSIKSSWINKTPQLFSRLNLRFLPKLIVNEIKDTKDICYRFFKNIVVKVTKDSINTISYQDLNGHVLAENIIDRHYNHKKVSRLFSKTPYVKFVYNISGYKPERFKAFMAIIGYLIHGFKNPANAKAIILYDEPINELNAAHGGSGKTAYLSAIGYMCNLCDIPGKSFTSSYNHKWQRINRYTNVVSLNDVQPNLNLAEFYNVITEDLVVNPKGTPEYVIRFEDGPKFIIASNYIIKAPEGFSTDRRKYEIELSTHYGKNRTIVDDFGHYFYYDWNPKQWNDFSTFMLKCVQFYLRNGLMDIEPINLSKRRLISEVGIELIEFLDVQFETKKKLHKKELFKEFITGGYVGFRYRPTQRTFTVKLKKYLEYKGLAYRETPSNTKAYIELITEDDPINYTTINDVDTKYTTVDTANKMTRMVNTMIKHFAGDNNSALALDFETTGLDPFTDKTVSLALSFKPKTGYNIKLPSNAAKRNKLLKPLLPWLADNTITKVFHNAKFDLKFFDKLNIELGGEIADTMVMDYVLDPSRKQHGLKHISKLHLNYQHIDFDEMLGGNSISDVTDKDLTNYACEDADITLQLYHYLTKKLQ